ncbi:MAG: glycosyltransferase family 2 protein [Verrucomicrobia bacterium]|nr:glycosyltransferase family 2 protein [Verrucomicrobiota bacterium]
MRVLAVIPAYNERGKIGNVVRKVPRDVVHEVLVVNDGSTDSTPDEARAAGATVISNPHPTGAGNSIRQGIHYARKRGYGIVTVMAGNDKDCPNEIPRLLDPILKAGYHFVQGSRWLKGGLAGNTPLYRRLATRLHPFLFSLVVGRRFTDTTNGFRAFRTSLFDDPHIRLDQPWLDKYELEPYIFFKAVRLGYKVGEVPATKIYPPKALGYTKMRPVTGWWSILRPIFMLGLGLRR